MTPFSGPDFGLLWHSGGGTTNHSLAGRCPSCLYPSGWVPSPLLVRILAAWQLLLVVGSCSTADAAAGRPQDSVWGLVSEVREVLNPKPSKSITYIKHSR